MYRPEEKAGKMNGQRLSAEFYDMEDSDNVCYLCGKPRYELAYLVTHYDFSFTFQRCQCGLVKQTPMPNERFFDWFFNSETFFSAKQSQKSEIWGYYDYFADEPSRLATSQRRYRVLSRILEPEKPLSIMKIGPATGTFLYVARQHGHQVRGCDVSSRFAAYAQREYRVPIDNGRFERMGYDDGQFDVVVLFNVIENVPNQVEFLQAIRRTLKPGGYFILNFVDMRHNVVEMWQKSTYFLYRPPVCYTYTRPVMARVLAKFGFSLVATYRDIRYMHLEKVATLLRWRWMLAGARVLSIDRRPFPLYAYPSKILVTQRGGADVA